MTLRNNGTHFTEYGQVFAVSYIVMINKEQKTKDKK
jgi:hypothetical protein